MYKLLDAKSSSGHFNLASVLRIRALLGLYCPLSTHATLRYIIWTYTLCLSHLLFFLVISSVINSGIPIVVILPLIIEYYNNAFVSLITQQEHVFNFLKEVDNTDKQMGYDLPLITPATRYLFLIILVEKIYVWCSVVFTDPGNNSIVFATSSIMMSTASVIDCLMAALPLDLLRLRMKLLLKDLERKLNLSVNSTEDQIKVLWDNMRLYKNMVDNFSGKFNWTKLQITISLCSCFFAFLILGFFHLLNFKSSETVIETTVYLSHVISLILGVVPACLPAVFCELACREVDKLKAGVGNLLVTCEDCLHLQLYRDPKDRFKKGQTKASLSLQQFLGFESGFTLDKESNTIAIICQDVVVVLAFETRERLIAWQVKVGSQLGSSREWLVMIGGGSRKLPAGPARLHLQGRRFALASGNPPRLLGIWELAHLRRYGVVEGRFCFEGGSHCGKGEGLHILITDQAQNITDGFDAAAHGNPRGPASRKSGGADRNRPDTRLSDLNADQSIPDTCLYEENFFGEDCGGVSLFWPSDERREFEEHDCRGCEEVARPPWSGADHVTLERCSNCVTKLGTMTRSSTVALTPGTQFNPAWTMEAMPESSSDNSSNSTEYLTPRAIRKSLEASQNKEWAPQRPPKPARLEEMKAPAPLPVAACTCVSERATMANANNPKVGPYENYDVPKATHVEVESANEYYDTPKRIKKALADDLFQVTKSSAPGNLILKKNCGCILKFGSKKKPVIVECDENIQPVECPCQKVTNWANNLISLPYCKRSANYDKVNTEVLTSQKSEEMALYATVDVSRKTNRQSSIAEKDSTHECTESPLMNYENLGPKGEELEDPYANYENLEFALSLEYYENAKDLLKKAGVTQKELDALSANVDFAEIALTPKTKHCGKCGHSAKHQTIKNNKSDEYLLMEPPKDIKRDLCKTIAPNPGYTPMSPSPNWSQSLRHPLQKVNRVEIEKSLSIPTLNGCAIRAQSFATTASNNNKETLQKRSSSVDSTRLLEDLKEFDSSIGSHATSSSLETLRNLAIENRRTSSPCDNERGCCNHDCCKSSDSENKTSEGSTKDVPHLRNKHMDNAQIKRSSSVPCKSGGNRDSSSSNDSGVSSCSMKQGAEFNEFETPLTSGHSRYQYMAQRRLRGNATGCIHSSLPRKSKSSDPLRDMTMQIHKTNVPAKSSSAEAEVPVLPPKQFKGIMDTHSTSSGTSDMSDYIETLSLTSSHSSSDNPNLRLARQPTTTLRPRSGKEYHNLDPIITSMYKNGKELSNYTNLP